MRAIRGKLGLWGTVCLCLAAVMTCQAGSAGATGVQDGQQATEGDSKLVIRVESVLPDAFPRRPYEFRFVAVRGASPLHWSLEKGALPQGFRLTDDGLLSGQTDRTGEFQFTVSVADSGSPRQAVQKEFILRVRSAFSLNWKTPAHVNGSRIEGSVSVANATPDDIDLTFVVVAVPPNGRATAIGYQHFVLRRDGGEQELPFGESLPRGGYVVHVDVVGEVESKNLIYRERMQTPGPLQVAVGP